MCCGVSMNGLFVCLFFLLRTVYLILPRTEKHNKSHYCFHGGFLIFNIFYFVVIVDHLIGG